MTKDQIYQLHRSLIGLDKKAAKAARIAFARLHRVTESAVVKRLAKFRGGRKGARAPRIGKQLEQAVGTIWNYKSTPDGQIATETAQQLAFSEGAIPRIFSISSLNQAARALGLNPDAPYCRRVEAEYANQAHFVDASGSRHFQVVERAEDGEWILRVVRAEQRNKRWRDGELLWIVSVIDDYSRVMSARYVVAPGESAAMVQETLIDVWRTGPPLGMPEEFLICDQGSFGKEQSTRALMEFYGIELVLGQPNNSQRNGRVERPFRSIKETFERSFLTTHSIGARVRLSQLKEELTAFVAMTNERRHPIRRGHTKSDDWRRSIAFRAVRGCPADALRLATYRREAAVGKEGWVQHDNALLEIVGLPAGLRGKKVTLVYNREGDLAAEHDGGTYPVRKAGAIVRGTYSGKKAPPAREIEKAAAARPRTGVGMYSKKRQAALRELGSEPSAPGRPVMGAAEGPRVITPPPRLRAVQPAGDPFAGARAYPDLRAAKERITEVLHFPLHMALNAENLARVEALLTENGLERNYTNVLAAELKTALGI